ncbi:MAG TPA: sulfite exporter TauE/SafE family protein [Beijerinckiaceae bacterium]|nr:sulfite exporter TauE/SafE family protein [Beijerinckiaceae bacterium]
MLADFFLWMAGPAPPATVALLSLFALAAGISRGLTGFGAGMIFVPLAGGLVGPQQAVALIWTMDAPNMVPVAFGSARRADWRESLWLFAGWLVSTPVGLWLLTRLDPLTVRWAVCILILCAMTLLIGGWSYRGRPSLALAIATGLVAGITGGLAGLSGPPIVMLWLAAAMATATNVRDNLNVFFLLTTVVNAVLLPAYGILTWPALRLGLLLALPYGLGVYAGTLAFRAVSDRNYRRAAYFVIGGAALLALPLMDRFLGR